MVHKPPAVACNKVVSTSVNKGSLSEERGTFFSVIIYKENPIEMKK